MTKKPRSTPTQTVETPPTSGKPAKKKQSQIGRPYTPVPRGRQRTININHWRIDGRTDTAWHDAFLDHFAKSLNVRKAAAKVGVSRTTVYDHVERYDDFAIQFEMARAARVEDIEEKTFEHAMKGDMATARFLLAHNSERYQRSNHPPLLFDEEFMASFNEAKLRLLEQGDTSPLVEAARKKRT